MAQWADQHRYLSSESSARPGKYRTAFAPYQREPMDAITDPDVSRVVLQWCSQVGKSEILNNAVGFFMHAEPAPMLMVQPTIELGESYSKERIAPMIRDTPVLSGLVSDPRSRDSGNTVLMKVFPGGSFALAGANAPGGLAGRPRRVVLLDEIDRFPISAGTEGDPCSLAIRRTETFHNAVVVLTSTPTIKGLSRIEKEFAESDQRQWFCPCPKCGEFQVLKWAQVQWPKEPTRIEAAYYECEKCRAHLNDAERRGMVMAGEWRPTAPLNGVRGYFLNGINNPFPHKKGFKSRLHQMVADFLEHKKKGSETLRVWTNTFLAETWEELGQTVEPDSLLARREKYGPELPKGVVLLTAGVDVQDEWIEGEIVGWGADEESWGIERTRIVGNPARKDTWENLDAWLSKAFRRVDGAELRLSCTLVDSGAHTKTVYWFTKPRQVRGVYACKGVGGVGVPMCGRFSRSNVARAMLFPIGTDTAKELLMSRFAIGEAGPGYMHFPMEYDREYFEQLTSEKKVKKWKNGQLKVTWEKIRPRNEALDCRVYATAALAARNFNLSKVAERVAKQAGSATMSPAEPPVELPPEQPEVKSPITPKSSLIRRGRGFVGSWRRW